MRTAAWIVTWLGIGVLMGFIPYAASQIKNHEQMRKS